MTSVSKTVVKRWTFLIVSLVLVLGPALFCLKTQELPNSVAEILEVIIAVDLVIFGLLGCFVIAIIIEKSGIVCKILDWLTGE